MRRSATVLTITGLCLATLLFISVNMLAGRFLAGASIDLTDQGLYTLSRGTRAILKKIDEPITLNFYYSSQLGEVVPSYGVYANRVRALLQHYASIADGKIRLHVLDPKPFSDVEDQATAAGLQAVPLEQGGESVYFGLVGTNSTDDTETIPFFQRDREKFLEYDLSRLVQALAFPKKKVVGLMSSLQLEGDPMAEMRGQPSQSQAVIEQLRQNYEVHDIDAGADSIPDDVDVLMLVQPDKLADKTQYAIDQFVLRGGHALVFADPYSEFAVEHRSQMSPPGANGPAHIDRLLKAWGLSLASGKFVGDRADATEVNAGDEEHPMQAEYLAWLTLRGDDIDENDPITGRLTQINVGTAGALSPVAGSKTSFETLLRSSDDSNLIDVSRIAGTPMPDVLGLLKDFKPSGKRYTIAARVTGVTSTAFPDGPPKDAPGKKQAQITVAKQPINVVVVADSDILDDRFWIEFQNFMGRKVGQPIAGNGDFVQNAIDSLSGTGDLINLRSRGSAVRPFTLVDSMRRAADDRYRAHEKELETRLADTQAKLAGIKAEPDADGNVQLTPDQQKTMDQFRAEIISTRTELRQVQLALRENIDRLKNRLVLFDIGLVPLVVAAFAVLLGIYRVRRRQRAPPRIEDRAMREETVKILAYVTVPAVALALLLPGSGSSTLATMHPGGLLLPGLKGHTDSLASMAITGPAGTLTLTRTPVAGKASEGWTLRDKGGYPVLPATVKPVLDGLLALHGMAPKTARAKLYGRLDLNDPGTGSNAHLIALADTNAASLGRIVLGKTKPASGVGGSEQIYARVPGQARAWLAEPSITLPSETLDWIDKSVVNIDPDQIKEVVLTQPGAPPVDLARAKPADKLTLRNLPPNTKPKSDTPGADVETSFRTLELQDVKPAKDVSGKPAGAVHLVTFNGITADFTLTKANGQTWLTVAATGAKPAANIAAHTHGWAYEIGADRVTPWTVKLADLVQPLPPPPAPKPAPPPPPAPPKK